MSIAFLTLFLGLTSGAHPVALSAGPGIASIELLLDGAAGPRLVGPPWNGTVDFGPLLPHHLVARGLDGQGKEVAVAEQWINLPRPPAEVEIVLERTVAGQPRTVHLAWQSQINETPASITLSLDGERLALDGRNRAELPPPRAGNATRLLSAELTFSNGIVARRDFALGSDVEDEVSTELTAVAVRLPKGHELPPPAQLQGWFSSGGKTLRVDSVEDGGARLLVVRDPRAYAILNQIPWIEQSPRLGALASGNRLRFISAQGRSYSGSGIPFELFARSLDFDANKYGVAYLVARAAFATDLGGHPRLADASAVAGLRAVAESGPRAVLLLLAPGTRDSSRYGGPAVRRYLAAIHVPLFVWSAGPPTPALKAAWGAVDDFTTRSGLHRAIGALERQLERQRVVMLEGRHLPQSIALSPAAGAVALEPSP